jgi:carotenoid 1,2-hydratase
VFSPYYRWALARRPRTAADDHNALNVALYGEAGKRWTMTERGRRHVRRDRNAFTLGPSAMHWDGRTLTIEIDEVAVPIPRRVRGRVRLYPEGLCCWHTGLDDGGAHRWGPIAPCARVDVEFEHPSSRWQGRAYLDSNEGDEPIESCFVDWDWSRTMLRDGSTAVIYDLRQRQGPDRVIAERFRADGSHEPFEAPPRQQLPRTRWRITRTMRSDVEHPARVQQTLEDTPFYVRSVLGSGLLGERVTSVHETLHVPRFAAATTQFMLPWRMPRVA